MKEIGLYIHIPFCKKKCLYCDFNSYKIHDEDEYIKALCEEIRTYLRDEEFKLKTVFIGGGTPTVIKYQNIGRIIDLIVPYIKKDAEITMECNPESIDKISIREYYAMGINRLSIGLQAKQNELLETIGRIHSFEDFLYSYSIIRNQGFKNINIDLMFSLPGQTMDMWNETLENICSLKPEHISCYSLILEESTPLYSLIKSGKLTVPDEDVDRNMYHLAEKVFSNLGYKQYEISNFAKEGYKCVHNLIYWKNGEYLGVGAGSHSKINSKRFWNVKDVKQYIDKIKNKKSCIEGFENINIDEDMWETILLNLRLNEGINISEFNKKYEKDFMSIYGDVVIELQKEDLLEKKGDKIVLTERGRDLSNIVFIKFSK